MIWVDYTVEQAGKNFRISVIGPRSPANKDGSDKDSLSTSSVMCL